MMKKLLVALVIGCAVSCDCGSAKSSGAVQSSSVKCFSGGNVIFESDNVRIGGRYREDTVWSFKDEHTGRLVTVTGDCVVMQ